MQAWPQKLREHLAREPENIILIEEIVRTVLRYFQVEFLYPCHSAVR